MHARKRKRDLKQDFFPSRSVGRARKKFGRSVAVSRSGIKAKSRSIIVAVLLGATSSYGIRVGDSYNDVEAELKARHAPYVAGVFDKDHRFLNVGHGQILATFHGDIAIAIIFRSKEPLTDAELKDIRGEGNWNLVVPGKTWVRSNDGVMFVYNSKDYTVSFVNAEGLEFLNQLPE
jgi:hypothetical protein